MTTTVPARPSLSLSPWTNQRPSIALDVRSSIDPGRTSKRSPEHRLTHTQQSLATNKQPAIPSRTFSQTTLSSSSQQSPFRLSSNNNNPNTSREEPVPEPGLDENDDSLTYHNPYKPKRQWPPDMTKLSPKHQFRLERKYRRRAALKFARPKWTKGTKLVQWGTIMCEFLRFRSLDVGVGICGWLTD